MKQHELIDLRSDTVTRPSTEMRKAMAEAEVGDDVYGEDPTVNRLQQRVASMLEKEAALFVPSGVMANQLAIKSQTSPGDEIVVDQNAHIVHFETAGAAFISGVQLRTVPGERGIIRASQLENALRPDVYYMPRTALICLENTHNMAGGSIYPLNEIVEISRFARKRKIALHLDGARLWNAAVALNIPPGRIARNFDTVSVCFSKGLGAPVGSALAGSKEIIDRARKFRKILGGGMRQAGVIAAGALFALERNVERLREDHDKARRFAEILSTSRALRVDIEGVQTNMVVAQVGANGLRPGEVVKIARGHGVLIGEMGPTAVRAVTHLDVSTENVEKAAQLCVRALRSYR